MTTSTRGAHRTPAVLVLEDGRIFRGRAYGAVGATFGEAAFSTGMTGYQETLTDPSYRNQIVVATAPRPAAPVPAEPRTGRKTAPVRRRRAYSTPSSSAAGSAPAG